VAVEASEACYKWGLEQARAVASEDFANQLPGPDGTLTGKEDLALQALKLASGKPSDTPAVRLHWDLMHYQGKLEIKYCYWFIGIATHRGAEVGVEVCVHPQGDWFASLPNTDGLLASSDSPAAQHGPSPLLACTTLTAALNAGAVLLSVKEIAKTGKYRIIETEQEFLWLSTAEQDHLRKPRPAEEAG
jgi:hypothetical protein